VTLSPGDALLYTVSSRRTLQWPSFKLAVDAAFPYGHHKPDVDMRYLRSEAAAIGDSLAHWDRMDNGQDGMSIVVAPPVLARLPWPGAPRGVLCGSRSPDTMLAIGAASASGALDVRAIPQQAVHPYAPSRIEIASRTAEGLAVLAEELCIPYSDQPPAWSMAVACGTVADYLASLEWKPDDHLAWPRRDFDPDRLAFGPPRECGALLRLSNYEHPRGWTRFDRIHREGQMAMVDRAWARYAVLAATRTTIVHYDHRAGCVTVPRQVPLPRLIARSLGLCSGQSPAPMAGYGLGVLVYFAVPQGIFDVISSKLDQPSVER